MIKNLAFATLSIIYLASPLSAAETSNTGNIATGLTAAKQLPASSVTMLRLLRNGNMRNAPSMQAKVIWWAAKDDQVALISNEGVWSKVRTKYGRKGWIGSKLLQPLLMQNNISANLSTKKKDPKPATPTHRAKAEISTDKSASPSNISQASLALTNANMRAAPSPNAPVIWWVEKNDLLTIIKHKNKWINVKTKYGKVGWVYEAALQAEKASPITHKPIKNKLPIPEQVFNHNNTSPAHLLNVKDSFSKIIISDININMGRTDARVLFNKDPADKSSFPVDSVSINKKQIKMPARVKILGSSTRRFKKKSLIIKFAKAQPELGGHRRITLHAAASDGSMMREYIAWNMMRRMGMIVPKVEYVRLKINGKNKGLFLSIEWVGGALLRSHNVQPQAMYQPLDESFCGDLNPINLKRMSHCWSTIFNNQGTAYAPLKSFGNALNHIKQADLPSWLEKHTNLDSIIDWIAINTLLSNGDTYNKNYFMVLLSNQKWQLIPWDYDLTFGRNWEPYKKYPHNIYNGLFQYYYPPDSGAVNPLKDKLLANNELRKRFISRLSELLGVNKNGKLINPNALYTSESMSVWIAAIKRKIAPEIAIDPFKSNKDNAATIR